MAGAPPNSGTYTPLQQMRKLTNARLVSRRLTDEWKLLSSVFIGILVAVTISVGSTVYLTALEQLAFKVSLNQISAPLLNLTVFAKRIPLTTEAVEELSELVNSIATEHIEDLYAGHEMYLRGTSSIVGTDEFPLPAIGDQESMPTVWDGFFHTLTNMEHHSIFLEGRAPNTAAIESGEGITVEATISEQVAEEVEAGTRRLGNRGHRCFCADEDYRENRRRLPKPTTSRTSTGARRHSFSRHNRLRRRVGKNRDFLRPTAWSGTTTRTWPSDCSFPSRY